MIRFEVHGKAAPAGSKRAFVVAGRAQVVDANPKAKPWKALVAAAAIDALDEFNGGVLIDQPVMVNIAEHRVRPKSHYGKTGLNAHGRRTPFPTAAPDTGKIARGIHDALEGVIYRNDALIVDGFVSKQWGDREHTVVTIIPLAVENEAA